MFDVGWSELLVIAVVALIVVGPKELPGLLRTLGRYAGKMRQTANEFRAQFDEAIREAELDSVRKDIESIRDVQPLSDIKRAIEAPMGPKTPSADNAPPAMGTSAEPPRASPDPEPGPETPAGGGEPKP